MSGPIAARVGRRGLIAGALATGAAMATGVGVAAAQTGPAEPRGVMVRRAVRPQPAAGGPVPETLTATGPSALDPEFPIDYLGVSWSGGSGGRVRFRTAAGWGPWQPVRPGDASAPGQPSALVPAGGAVAAEVDPPADASDLQMLAINTTAGPRTERVFAEPFRRYGCPFRNRAGWGADESLRFDSGGAQLWSPTYHPVQTITVHHQGAAADRSDPAATVRAIYAYQAAHPDNQWGDIGYHLLIDHAGVVYEGRYSGPDGIPVFRRNATRTRRVVEGGHALGFNPGNIGVVLLGNLTSAQPTAAARRSLVRVLASLAQTCRLDPLARRTYENPVTGATRTVHIISGHRDWNSTQCPGDACYPTLPAIRQDVAALIASGAILR